MVKHQVAGERKIQRLQVKYALEYKLPRFSNKERIPLIQTVSSLLSKHACLCKNKNR